MEFYECYALSYAGARAKFVAAARQAGASLASYEHPEARGPAGEPLTVDVACIGEETAKRGLLVISGTHGQEGFAGSAIQVGWLKSLTAPLTGVRVVLVHGLNPWGFANFSRSNENNVDLNRNFVDHGGSYPENPGYDFLHPAILLDAWTRDTLAWAESRFTEYETAHGKDALYNSLASGQYTHADGLNYGGRERQWSNLVLERIVREHLSGVDRVGLVDWHTGIGEYGKLFFLCFSDTESEEFAQSVAWWGADKVANQRPFGMTRPQYRGLVFHGIQSFLGDVPLAGAVVEVGTRGLRMRRALRLDLWLKFRADPSSEQYEMLHADMRDGFCPVEQAWREEALLQGVDVTQRAVDGMAAWG